jgi:integral membrane sensor domain MASE1
MIRHRVLSPLAFAIAYAGLAVASMRQLDTVTLSTLFWPCAGLLMAALLLSPPRHWPGWMVLAATLHTAIGMVAGHRPAIVALTFAIGDLLFCWMVVGLWRWQSRDREPATLTRLRGALWFIGLLACGAAGGGALVAFALRIVYPASSPQHWYVWSMAAFVGCMVTTPLVLAWSRFRVRRLAEQDLLSLWVGLIAAFAVLVGTTIVFDDPPRATEIVWHDGFGMSYGPLLFLSLVALCWGAPGSTLTVAGLALIAGSYTISGMGPYANIAHFSGEPLLAVQGYLGCAAVLSVLIGALSADRRRALHKAAALKGQLLAALRAAGQAAWEFRPATNSLQWLGELPFGVAPPNSRMTLDQWLAHVHPDDQHKLRAWLHDGPTGYAARSVQYRLRKDGIDYQPVEMTGSEPAGATGPSDRSTGMLAIPRDDMLF